MIRFECQCGKIYQVSDQYAGKKTKCPKCGNVCLVPSAEVQSSESIIKFFCSQCGQKIKVPKEYSGKKCKCPKCLFLCIIPCLSDSGMEMPDSHDIEKEPVSSFRNESEIYKLKEPDVLTQKPQQIDTGISLTQSGDVIFKGSFNQAFNLITQTIEEVGGKVVKADIRKGYIEGKYKYGVNLFGIRVCVSISDEGQHCVITFKGKLKDAFDTLGHAKKRADEVKTRFLHKLETQALQIHEQARQNFYQQGVSPTIPHGAGNVVHITNTAPSGPAYGDALGVGWVIFGWCMAFFIPFIGFIFGIVCCSKKRAGNGVGMIILSIFMFFFYSAAFVVGY